MSAPKTPAAKSDAKPKAAAAKALAKKAEVKPAAKTAAPETKPVAKAEPKKAPAASGQVKVTQVVGCIGRSSDQQATLIGLGLNKRHRSRVLVDTPEVRGMIYKVRHLVKAEKVS